MRRRSVIARTCAGLAAMLAIVLGGEWFVGTFSPASYDNVIRSAQGGYAYVPEVRGAYRSIESQRLFRLETNAMGARDKEWAPSGDGLRIDVVGNSFVDATGVAIRERFSARLEERLRGAGIPAHVQNLGVQGQSLINHVDRALMAERDHHPDLVVLALTVSADFLAAPQTTFRDDSRVSFALAADGVHREQVRLGDSELRTRHLRAWIRERWLGRIAYQLYLQTTQWTNGRFGVAPPACAAATSPDGQTREDGFRLTEAIVGDLLAQLGQRLVIILIPSEDQMLRPAGLDCDWTAPSRWLVDYARRTGAQAIDLSGPFQEQTQPQFFPHGHMNPAGHRTVAETLFAWMKSPGVGR